jgi:hypothetical protein
MEAKLPLAVYSKEGGQSEDYWRLHTIHKHTIQHMHSRCEDITNKITEWLLLDYGHGLEGQTKGPVLVSRPWLERQVSNILHVI